MHNRMLSDHRPRLRNSETPRNFRDFLDFPIISDEIFVAPESGQNDTQLVMFSTKFDRV